MIVNEYHHRLARASAHSAGANAPAQSSAIKWVELER